MSATTLLQALNRWQPLLAHWADAGNLHPETSMRRWHSSPASSRPSPTRKRPNAYPAYRHNDLSAALLRSSRTSGGLGSESPERRADSAEGRRHGLRTACSRPQSGWRRVLRDVVSAELPSSICGGFPDQVKIGAVEHISSWSMSRCRASRGCTAVRRGSHRSPPGRPIWIWMGSPLAADADRAARDPCPRRIPEARMELWAILG